MTVHSYEGRATILSGGEGRPLEATVVIDDILSSSWVGIIRLLDDTDGPYSDESAQVVLRSDPYPGLVAAARLMVPFAGLPTLRGLTRFGHEAGCDADAGTASSATS
jgi:hypothetical protein